MGELKYLLKYNMVFFNKHIKIADDYEGYIYDYFKGGVELPIKSPGFNLAFTKFKNKYVFVFRNVIPYKKLIDKKEFIPGISKSSYDLFIRNKYMEYFEESNCSENFFWDWRHFYNTSILFVGDIDNNLNIIVDKSIKPYPLINPIHCFFYERNKVSENKLNNSKRNPNNNPNHICSQYFNNMEDFRLYNFKGRLYLINSTMNIIYQLYISSNSIKKRRLFTNICNVVVDMKKLSLSNSEPYQKIHEKNWSLYNVDVDKNIFHFLHDFSEEGVEGVVYDGETKKCEKSVLIRYPKDTFPIDSNIFRISFGSSCVYFNSKTRRGYLGVGHVKLRQDPKREVSSSEKHFQSIYKLTNIYFRKYFKEKFKPHPQSQYLFFFFLYDEKAKKFYISKFYIAIPKFKYYFNIIFPMSIVPFNKQYLVSMGYGDFTNLLIQFSPDEIEKSLQYDISKIRSDDIGVDFLIDK